METVQTNKSDAHKLRIRLFRDLELWLAIAVMTNMFAVVPMTEAQQYKTKRVTSSGVQFSISPNSVAFTSEDMSS